LKALPAALAKPVEVVYIGGWIYSGSTILGNILGQVDGFFAAGEVRFVWRRGMIENQACGCGACFADCAFWTSVIRGAVGGSDHEIAHRMLALDRALLVHRKIPWLAGTRPGSGKGAQGLAEYRGVLAPLYAAIREASGGRIIIDQSKSPLYALVLADMPSIDLRVVHLIRDPRGSAGSVKKRRQAGRPGIGMIGSTVLWALSHTITEMVGRRQGRAPLRVRYEDFALSPETTVRALLESLAVPASPLPFVDSGRVFLRPNHNVDGNPNRLRAGAISIRPDETWRLTLSARDRALVQLITWPWRARYGYL
jgi:hypothetical protein